VYSVVLPLAVLNVTGLYEAREDDSAEVCYAIFYSPECAYHPTPCVCCNIPIEGPLMLMPVKYARAHECPSYAYIADPPYSSGLHTIL